jgi:hypothetical protein
MIKNIPETKKCKICNIEKSFDEFYPLKSGKYGIDSKCRKCDLERNKKFNKTEKGLIFEIYRKQKKQAISSLQCSREEFYDWLIDNQLFLNLHKLWITNNYDEDFKPACYKIDFDLPFTLNNLALATSKQVKEKYFEDIRLGINYTINDKTSKPVLQYTKDGKFLKKHHSIRAAERHLQEQNNDCRLYNTGITRALNNPKKSSHGFKWVEDTTSTEKTLYGKEIELKQLNNHFIEDIENILENEIPINTEKEELIKCRMGQGKFRNKLIKYWNGCSVTDYKNIDLLVASHIKPWRNSSDKERLDLFNGLLLIPNLDRLFDIGYISFDDEGRIIISEELEDYKILGINKNMKINIQEEHKKYLDYHRKEILITNVKLE